MQQAAPCLVATWPALAQAQSPQDLLLLSNSACNVQFRLGVMIARHNNKFVCLFR